MDKMEKQKQNELPAGIDRCALGPASIFIDDSEPKKPKIRLTMYDGGIHKHWWYGQLAFDASSMNLAKKKIPILWEHNTNQRLGVGEAESISPSLVVGGPALSNKFAQEIIQDAREGFPFESSLRFNYEKAKLRNIEENETIEVNGLTMNGPGTVVYNAQIMEGSLAAFGALSNTTGEIFNNNKQIYGDLKMDKQKEVLTRESFSAEYPELFSEIWDAGRAEGIKVERERFARFHATFAKDPAFMIAEFANPEADYVSVLEKYTKQLEDKPTELQVKVDPARQEFMQDKLVAAKSAAELTDDGKPETYDKKIEDFMVGSKMSKGEAMSAAARVVPLSHTAWIKAFNMKLQSK